MKNQDRPGAKPRKKIVAGIAAIAALVLVGSGQWPFPSSETTDSGNPDSIIIGVPAIEHSALIYIAEDQGFFAKNGLNVTTRDYTTSPEAVGELLNNVVNMASIGEYTFVGKAFKKENISVIGNIDKFETTYLIGRKDRNNLTAEKTLPYFRDHIYTKGLEVVKPEAVNIIG